MITCDMGGRVDGLGNITTSSVTINTFYKIPRGRVAGILRPISTSATINNNTTPLVNTITTYILPLITIIYTNINPIIDTTTIYPINHVAMVGLILVYIMVMRDNI